MVGDLVETGGNILENRVGIIDATKGRKGCNNLSKVNIASFALGFFNSGNFRDFWGLGFFLLG